MNEFMNRLYEIVNGHPSGAIIEDEYRYLLWRKWDPSLEGVLFIMLNPSTADSKKNDPTITKCIKYAKNWGFGSLFVVNLYAYRTSDPRTLVMVDNPVGPKNDEYIKTLSSIIPNKIAAWGNSIFIESRVKRVYPLVDPVYYLDLSKSGNPKHPLYLPKNIKWVTVIHNRYIIW